MIYFPSFLSLPISGWILTPGWQFGANPTEFEQNAKFRPIPGHNGQVGYIGYKYELMSNILRWIMNALNDILTRRCRCRRIKISSNIFLIKPSQVQRFPSNNVLSWKMYFLVECMSQNGNAVVREKVTVVFLSQLCIPLQVLNCTGF